MEHIKNVHENTDHRPSNYISKDSLIPPLSKQGNDGMGLFFNEWKCPNIITCENPFLMYFR